MTQTGERLVRLTEFLARGTEAGTVKWQRGDGWNTFVLSVPSGSVRLAFSPRDQPMFIPPDVLEVRDANGRVTDTLDGNSSATTAILAITSAVSGARMTGSERATILENVDRLRVALAVDDDIANQAVTDILRDLGG